MTMEFPNDFRWGAATAAYQIEGAAQEDGRGPSIWDTFSKTPGKVANGDTGDVACDHYHRFEQDIALMQELGIDSYRFSIAWPRLFPKGDATRNEAGFAFYDGLINALIAAGIEPVVTLYHWDLPQPLEDAGGWANRDTVFAFAVYARACAEAFGDRVSRWITLNEPWCTTWLGYRSGVHAPGKQDLGAAIASAHHTALAHGAATRAMKDVNASLQVGITLNMTNYIVAADADAEAFEASDLLDAQLNRWWIDAFMTGAYPEVLKKPFGEHLTSVLLDGDSALLKTPPDFLGINYYSDSFVRSAKVGSSTLAEEGFFPFDVHADLSVPEEFHSTMTDMEWPVTPDGLGTLLSRVHHDWPQIPHLMVTENGAAFDDGPDSTGAVNDSRRSAYLTGHIESMHRAVTAGVPVKAYFAWSLLDNFEWAYGYAKRFGLVFVDFATQQRTMKASAFTYKSIIEASRVRA
jgi:beta-glucosidase